MEFPKNLRYSKEHEWISVDGNIGTIGITEFAQSELGDLVYVDIDTLDQMVGKDEIFGTVEAVKTTSDLYMPVSGKVIEVNEALLEHGGDNPALINTAPYTDGWIIKIELSNAAELDDLMDADTYQNMVGA